MDVVSTCPLRVASVVWQPRAGAWALTLVCKATFQLQPGVSPLAEAQAAPADDDAHHDGDPTRSLHLPGDLVPFKARADVLLVGHAFAPGGQPVRTLAVHLAAGGVDKRLEVWCDRIFWHEGRLLEGQPFTRMPLRWERAAGGPGTANPVGMRFDAPPDAHGAIPIPNLQPPGIRVARRGETFAPVGLGPIAPHWPGRAAKLGRHAAGWSHRQWRERPLPADLDRAYFNAAPPDQQVDALDPTEPIVLENLHPEHPKLETRLFGETPFARMTAGGRAGEDVVLTADTLWIDTDRGLATVVWRGRVPLSHAAEEGRVTVSMRDAGVQGTVALEGAEGGAGGAVLPFGQQAAGTATVFGGMAGGPALPFGPPKSVWEGFATPPAAGPAPEPADTGTVYGVRFRAGDVLPFPTAPAAEPPPPPPAIEPVARVEVDEPTPPPPPVVAPPEMLGPLAPPAPIEAPAPEAEAAPAEMTLERCAALTASIARKKAETAQILEAKGLDAAAWAGHRQRWEDAIRDETARGRTELLERFDRAYVAQLEEERGPIGVEDYARLVVATERGNLAGVLAEMALPRGAMMRIERVWLGKLARDAELGRSVRHATKAAREA